MVYTTEYASPLGPITLACDGEAIIGLWFNGQRYFGNILPEQTEKKEHPLFADAKRWLDVYFSGREPDFLPPLRYDSTPFRRLICEIMLTIPYGKTMTYGQIAEAAGRREDVRAGGRRRGRAQPDLAHDPVPPRRGHKRQSHRLWRRHRAEGQAAGIGARRYARPVCTENGNRTLRTERIT